MPGAGRKPKPLAMKMLDGNPGKHPLNFDEPAFDGAAPEMPRHLGKTGRRFFKRYRSRLNRAGVVKEADGTVLGRFCMMQEMKEQMIDHIRKNGFSYVEHFQDDEGALIVGNMKPNPVWKQYIDAERMQQSCEVELGLTPAARARLRLPKPPVDDDAAAYLKQAQQVRDEANAVPGTALS